MNTTLRETCKSCGETHVSRCIGITNGADYSVVVERCNFCEAERAEQARVEEYLDRIRRNG